MQTIYAFSGLGADSRAFANLDLSGYTVVHIDWLLPNSRESLSDYVLRLAEKYSIPKQGAFVIGISFGGMCLSTLAKTYDFAKIVFISTAKTKYELPRSYRFSKYIPLYKLIPAQQLTKSNAILAWLFSAKTSVEKQLLKEIIEGSNPTFLKWAINCIIHWDNTVIPTNFFHIHGDEDRIIPISNVKYMMRIRNGGHLMALNKAEELSLHIRKYLAD